MAGAPGLPAKAREWVPFLDALAVQANADYEHAALKAAPDDRVPSCLLAIASQMAYGNAVRAAAWFMTWRPDLEEEGGST